MSSIFIPAKEILSHSCNLNAAAQVGNVRFDDTYLDIINAAKVNISAGRNSETKNAMLEKIQKMTGGTVVYDAKRDEFYLKVETPNKEFTLVAEGIRKMALLAACEKWNSGERFDSFLGRTGGQYQSPIYLDYCGVAVGAAA